jgi:ABC-type Mn2+/Zn2+ transport system ATPase subunit
MNELAIDCKDLTKTYGNIRAVEGINLSVPRGAIYGFLGRNGAGKTSTIKMLLGLTRPTSGSAQVLGMDVMKGHLSILQRTAFVSVSVGVDVAIIVALHKEQPGGCGGDKRGSPHRSSRQQDQQAFQSCERGKRQLGSWEHQSISR